MQVLDLLKWIYEAKKTHRDSWDGEKYKLSFDDCINLCKPFDCKDYESNLVYIILLSHSADIESLLKLATGESVDIISNMYNTNRNLSNLQSDYVQPKHEKPKIKIEDIDMDDLFAKYQ